MGDHSVLRRDDLGGMILRSRDVALLVGHRVARTLAPRLAPDSAPHSALLSLDKRGEYAPVLAVDLVVWVAGWAKKRVAVAGGATPGFTLAPDPDHVGRQPFRESLPLRPHRHCAISKARSVPRCGRAIDAEILGLDRAPSRRLRSARPARGAARGLDGASVEARWGSCRWLAAASRSHPVVPSRRDRGTHAAMKCL
jgi:hypothetical protein